MRVVGYFEGVLGTGEYARQLVPALRTQGIPITTTTLHPDAPEDDELARHLSFEPAGHRHDDPFERFVLLCANADMVPSVADQLGEEFFADHYTIGFWWWEVSAFPMRFLPAFSCLDEVWVGSHHVGAAVAKIATVPVTAIPQPVSLSPEAARAAPPPGLPDAFLFLFAFDYLSVFERKNPLAAVEAFKRAFPPGSGAALVIKSLNGDRNPVARSRLRDAVARHPDIDLMEPRLTKAEYEGLMNAADCYVSLHRAEGFGFTTAQAMWLGTPVIATRYSGNLDYMSEKNSYLVDYALVPIGAGHDPYPAEGVWAEPDVDHAATLMRQVFEDREEGRRRGARAAQDIRASHGPAVAGRVMAERLRLLAASKPAPTARRTPQRSTAVYIRQARHQINSGPVPGTPRFGAVQQVARKTLLRLLKPVTAHARSIDSDLLKAIEGIDARMESLARSHDQALRRIDELEAELRKLREGRAD
jgi:glycosyltransferase involved in cell wall biosynthesis